jgi:hypothetical protein
VNVWAVVFVVSLTLASLAFVFGMTRVLPASEKREPPPDVRAAIASIRAGEVTERAVEAILDEVKRRTADSFVAAPNWEAVLKLKGILLGAGLVLELLENSGLSAVERANERRKEK